MAGMVASGLCCETVARGREFLLFVVGLWVLWSGAVVRAQGAPKPQDEPITTLHVYTNLVQVPVVVLGPNRERLTKPVAESKFSISIDGGPWFRATHVRQEGDEPISLSILLDVSGDEVNLMPKMADAIAGLAPLSLSPKDRVSIYALDCSLVRSLNDVPAASEQLKAGVDSALESWKLRKQERHKQKCQQSVPLWDAVTYLASELYRLPGRRVILAISDGDDKGSRNTWSEASTYAKTLGVAVFGVTYLPTLVNSRELASQRWRIESPFRSLCEWSGGLVFLTSAELLGEMLQQFTTTVRERYIVEFPRPAKSTPGRHGLEIRIAKSDDYIGGGGITVPAPDPALLADPSTVPSDPSRTPEMGTRKIMTKPQ